MRICVITLFPEMFKALTDFGVTGRAVKNKLVSIECINPRDFTEDSYQTVDDRPYGGGPGMLLMTKPLCKAIEAAKQKLGVKAKVYYLSPQGEVFSQRLAQQMSVESDLILIAGRYEGIDQRVVDSYVDVELSIGDYVLSGGELPSMVVLDAIFRLVPGVLGDIESAIQDSFTSGMLDFSQYTRPEQFNGMMVPKVLLNGCHSEINRWRTKNALGKTYIRRPDVFKNLALTDEQEKLLAEYIQEMDSQE